MNKYKAIKTKTGGVTYDSKGEARYAQKLEWRKIAGEIREIERQFIIPFYVNGVLICSHIVDFRITLKDGSVEYHEFKGMETPVYKIKKKLFGALYPNEKYVLIK